MLNVERNGIRFAVFNGKKRNERTNISETQLDDTTTASHIHIMPKVAGSGGKTMGWLQVVAGAVLIATGVGAGFGAGMFAASAMNFGMICLYVMKNKACQSVLK